LRRWFVTGIEVALALAVLIGASLGMLGGGGSMITMPVLVYVAGVDLKGPSSCRWRSLAAPA
jgi:uncharacterized membrane protein YfcA